MDGIKVIGPDHPHKEIDFDHLPKDRRDWLEIFGNLWGTKHYGAERLTAEEKAELAKALNPFAD